MLEKPTFCAGCGHTVWFGFQSERPVDSPSNVDYWHGIFARAIAESCKQGACPFCIVTDATGQQFDDGLEGMQDPSGMVVIRLERPDQPIEEVAATFTGNAPRHTVWSKDDPTSEWIHVDMDK